MTHRTARRTSLFAAPLLALLLVACGARAVVSSREAAAATSAATAVTAASPNGTPTNTRAAEAPASTATPTPAATAASTPRPTLPPPLGTNNLAPRTNRQGFVVALDPGHGGDESGAAANGVVERDSNLDMALRVGGFLKAAGVQVYYTRTDGGRSPGIAGNGDTRSLTRDDLQARVIGANRAGADVFVSLHSNGSGDPYMRGVEVYYESRRTFADENYRLAQYLIDGALRGLANAGIASPNRGIIDAACWRNLQGRCVGLFVLSPGGSVTSSGTGTVKEATAMPAALLETLFVSSPDDAALLKNDTVRTSVARGIADGILRYLGVGA